MKARLLELSSLVELEGIADDARTISLGSSAQSPRRFYVLEIVSHGGQQTVVKLQCSHHGIRPSWIFSEHAGAIAIGFDASIAFVNITREREAVVRPLDGVFYEFVNQPDVDYVLVLHELGVAEFDFSGCERWSVSTPDITESAQVQEDGLLVVHHQGSQKKLIVEIGTGRIVPAM